MTVLMLSYDLNGKERPSAYDDVKVMIEKYADSWKKPLFSQWFIATSDSPETWHGRMKKVADDDDNWFICKVTSTRQGWLNKDVWEWLRKNE